MAGAPPVAEHWVEVQGGIPEPGKPKEEQRALAALMSNLGRLQLCWGARVTRNAADRDEEGSLHSRALLMGPQPRTALGLTQWWALAPQLKPLFLPYEVQQEQMYAPAPGKT